LRHIQACRGAAEVQLLGDGDEGPEVTDLHVSGGLAEGDDLAAAVHEMSMA
jgi:hypothetical protein